MSTGRRHRPASSPTATACYQPRPAGPPACCGILAARLRARDAAGVPREQSWAVREFRSRPRRFERLSEKCPRTAARSRTSRLVIELPTSRLTPSAVGGDCTIIRGIRVEGIVPAPGQWVIRSGRAIQRMIPPVGSPGRFAVSAGACSAGTGLSCACRCARVQRARGGTRVRCARIRAHVRCARRWVARDRGHRIGGSQCGNRQCGRCGDPHRGDSAAYNFMNSLSRTMIYRLRLRSSRLIVTTSERRKIGTARMNHSAIRMEAPRHVPGSGFCRRVVRAAFVSDNIRVGTNTAIRARTTASPRQDIGATRGVEPANVKDRDR